MTRFATLLNCGAAAIALAAALAPAPAAAQASASPFTGATRYDAIGRVTGTISADPDGAGALPFLAVRNWYDAAGRLIKVETGTLSTWQAESIAPENWTGFTVLRTLETGYDAMDRKLRDTLKDGTGAVQTVTQYSYDVMGRLDCTAVRMNPATFAALPSSACTAATASATYGPDRISRNVYDAAGQRLQLREAVGVSGQEAAEATWAYDADGRVTTMIDANGNRAELRYDGHGRQDRWTFPSTTGPTAYDDATQASALASAGAVNAADYEGYSTDPAGNRTSLRHRAGNVTAFAYDHLNRLATRDRPAGERDVTYGYDLRGLQTSATFTGTSDAVTNAFDGFGRPLSSSIAMGGTTRTLLYRHDPDGNRTRITYPDGNWWQQDYDGLNRPTWLSYAGSYGQQYLNYNTDGTAQAANKANGTSVAFSYDGVQRMAGFSLDAAGMASDSGWTLGRNPANQIVALTRSNDLYAYAPANAATAYAIDGLNRAVQVGGASVTYDGNGNLTGDPGPISGGASATTFAYDSENRLVSASGAHSATLAYDPLDRLYQLTGGGTVTTFLYDGDALVAEYEGSTLLRRHIHWPGADVPVVTWEGAGLTDPRYLHADERGSIVAISDLGGAATLNRYDEYGVPGAGNSGRFGYTGQLWLPQLGLYYYKARMYSPYGGRFMQTDPIEYEGGYNLYGYASGDPLNNADPGGTCAIVTGSHMCGADEEEDEGTDANAEASNRQQQSAPNVQLAMNQPGGEEETRNRGGLLGEIFDPTAELREETFYNSWNNIQRQEPNNPSLTYYANVRYNPTWQAVNAVEAEARQVGNRTRVIDYARAHGGASQPGYRSSPYSNDGRQNTQILPGQGVTFREYDVRPFSQGVNRGLERIVIDSRGRAYYTNNHYMTFRRIR